MHVDYILLDNEISMSLSPVLVTTCELPLELIDCNETQLKLELVSTALCVYDMVNFIKILTTGSPYLTHWREASDLFMISL